MKCPKCDGWGVIDNYEGEQVCPQCHGTGRVRDMTKEKWLKSLDTEELANVLWRFMDKGFRVRSEISIVNLPTKNDIVEWLKEEHKE